MARKPLIAFDPGIRSPHSPSEEIAMSKTPADVLSMIKEKEV